MRKTIAILFALLLCVSAFAQQRTGNIYGRVADQEGNALPGVTVTLDSPFGRVPPAVTSAEGTFRFLSLPPSRNYGVKLELTGFKTRIETGIVVTVGSTTNLALSMEMGVLEEQVTVTAVSPMVDTKKTAVGQNVTQEVLQELPTARDPWVILQMAPSIIVDRENVGGAESGQQSNYVGRGSDTYNNNVWAMDGVVITDPSAIGASPSYYDFDAFEEMQIVVGGADVTVQTGGIALNMVTRRGSNKITLGGRFYVTDSKFQADNFKPEFAEEGALGINKIRNNKDYGFNLGMPIVRDRAWLWISYGVQDIKTTTVYATRDDTLLQNYAGKLNIQIIPQNRFEAFVHVGGKEKFGRSASAALPDGYAQAGRYHFGSPIIKFQDEHMFGDSVFVSLKYAFADAGFSLTPVMDLDFTHMPTWDETAQRWFGSEWRYLVKRPTNQYNFMLDYFNDSLFGASHDFKVGFEYAHRNEYVESVYSGNARVNINLNYPTVDIDGDGLPDVVDDPNLKYFSFWRGYYNDHSVNATTAFIQDTVTFGRFNLLLGVRWDRQVPYISQIDVLAAQPDGPAWQSTVNSTTGQILDGLLPGITIPETTAYAVDGSKYNWTVWSPRIGLTWDVTGNGKTIAKLSFSQYGDFMGTFEADRWRPGGSSGWLDFYWWDNGDGMMDFSELYWYHIANYQLYHVFNGSGGFIGDWNDAAGTFWGSFDHSDPSALSAPYTSIQPDAGSSRTTEFMLQLDRELFADFAVSIVGTYRKYGNFRWTLTYFPDENLFQNPSWYISAGTPPAEIPGIASTKEAAQHQWYYTSEEGTAYTPYRQVQLRPGYWNDYWGLDLVLNKRLSNKWMMNANFTWQKQSHHYGDQGSGYMDPTNIWAYEGKPQAAYIGGASGKINQYTYTPWMFKVSGLYQFPWDISLSGTFQARQGWIIREYFQFVDYTLPNPKSRSANLDMTPFGSEHLPLFYNLTLRAEKMLRLGDTGRIYLMVDVFNVLNSALVNRRYQKYWGTYYVYSDSSLNYFRPDANFDYTQKVGKLNEILNPRIMRLGIRFVF